MEWWCRKHFLTKAILLFGVFLLFPFCARAETIVSQNITTDTTWTKAESPYIISTPIVVTVGTRLGFEAGTIVKFHQTSEDAPVFLEVRGKLVSEGTQSEQVIFTSYSDDGVGGDTNGDGDASLPRTDFPDYEGIVLKKNGMVQLPFSTIRYGSIHIDTPGSFLLDGLTLFQSTIHITTATVSLLHLTATHSPLPAVSVGTGATVTIDGAAILESATDGISVVNGGKLVLTNSHISDSTEAGLSLKNGSSGSVSKTIFEGGEYGVHVWGPNTLELSESTLSHASDIGLYDSIGPVIIGKGAADASSPASLSPYDGATLTVLKNTITQNAVGVNMRDISTFTIHQNAIYGNTAAGADGEGANPPLEYTGNWWGDESGPFNSATNPEGKGDVVTEGIQFSPWLSANPLLFATEPLPYFAEVTSVPDDVLVMRDFPSKNAPAIKTLPNGWIVKVLQKTTSGAAVISDGYRWYRILDPTDGAIGWGVASPENETEVTARYLPYNETIQDTLEEKSSYSLNDPTSEHNALRRQTIREAVAHFLGNTDSTSSLYSSNDSSLHVSDLGTLFSPELILGIMAQESGSINFDNEFVTYDYGHGITQVTMNAWKNEPGEYGKNSEDNRGFLSKLILAKCRNFNPNIIDTEKGINDYKNCYQNTSTKNKLKKPYDHYLHLPSNPIYKAYTNTTQSIYANIKDGLGILRDKMRYAAGTCPKPARSIGDYTFTCEDMQKIKTIWAYNGIAFDTTTGQYTGSYLKDVASKLEHLSEYFPGASYDNPDHFIEKLRIANDNKKVVRIYSPVEIRGEDQSGRVTGVINGEAIADIPDSLYDPVEEAVVVFFPEEEIRYKAVGLSNDVYGIRYESTKEGREAFADTGEQDILPTKIAQTDTFTFDDTALSGGEETGVLIETDEGSDGTIEETSVSGSAITSALPLVDFSSLKGEYTLGDALSIRSLVSDRETEQSLLDVKAFLNGEEVALSGDLLTLSRVGENLLKVQVSDTDGNTTQKETSITVRYLFLGFKEPLSSDGVVLSRSRNIPISFSVKASSKVPVRPISPTLSVMHMEDSSFYPVDKNQTDGDPSCDSDDACFIKEKRRYTYTIPKKALSVGMWNVLVGLDDGSIHEKLFTITE